MSILGYSWAEIDALQQGQPISFHVGASPILRVVVSSQVNLLVQGVNEESYSRLAEMREQCQTMANELRKPVVLFLARETGKQTFNPV